METGQRSDIIYLHGRRSGDVEGRGREGILDVKLSFYLFFKKEGR